MMAALLTLALFGAYAAYLDIRLLSTFEGKRWAVPARVFARPLELYVGAEVSLAQLRDELEVLGYRRAERAPRPGAFRVESGRLAVSTRGFRFWDGVEPSRGLRISFAGGRIAAIESDTAEPVALVRLEPRAIGAIYPSQGEDRVLVRVSDVPPLLVATLLAVEDRQFYDHAGIDPRAVARAAWANLRARRVVQGASTLTQQLVKNFFLTPERTLWRKANEALMALMLEFHYDKEEILEAYLNEIYLGQRGRYAIHGFGLAARFYFNRPVERLDAGQIALLVGLIRGPSYYDPWRYPERVRARRDRVLAIMASQGLIERAVADAAAAQDLGVGPRPEGGASPYPAFLDLVRRQLRLFYREEDLTSEGLQIFTTLDPGIQETVERQIAKRLPELARDAGQPADALQTAVVVTARERGEVVALVGGRDPQFPGFNRVLDAARPVGSLMKPVVYLAALSDPARYHLLTPLEDRPVRVQGPQGEVWSPANFDRQYRGEVTLREALVDSLNVPVVRVGLDIGLDRVVATLRQLGAQRPLEPYPALLLGAASLSPLEVNQIYQTLADGGFATPLRSIREVVSPDGTPLRRYPLTVKQVADPAAVYLVDRLLQEVVARGTAKGLNRSLPPGSVAGKTGTTDGTRDSWFAGFSADYVAVAWLGRDDNAPVGLTGSGGAMRLWGDIMGDLADRPLDLTPPEGIVELDVDRRSGLLGGLGCRQIDSVPFIRGSEPRRSAPCVIEFN